MNTLELFKATVNHIPHEEFLFFFHCTPDLDKRLRQYLNLKPQDSFEEYFDMPRVVHVSLKPPAGFRKPDFSKYYEDMDIPHNAFINDIGVLEIPGSMYHFTRYVSPLRNAKTLKEIEDFPYPNVDGWIDSHMAEEVRKAHENNKPVICWVGHIYETAWQIRGYEQFLMDMILNPEICEFILDKICERNMKVAQAAARAGVDWLTIGDDVANERTLMFSIEHWRRFMKPRWAKVIKAAKDIKPDIQVDYHSDGNIMDIIPELIEIGVTILNPIQPECMDPIEVKRKYGKHLVLKGTVGTQSTMPFGTPDEVKRVVRERKRTLGYDGALILEPTHVLEPDVPIENVIAFVEACKEKI
ncbi:uroporphyrinogen decarboxylase [Caldicoprobacter guelmensis]|uniref:uroporphyrinogen decarboxylase family protein n=1 Tax=Caldicoprobacter guelmensis TaxID=1170224 RepID=UPI00195D2101|nr:uroporphyrinogen decarboxylase family protein [Caldicoprobacter guelmensis]MBM7582139.1 uroporphyrinogen decarboxylase [Caldicoprobacter guelmensis]